MIKVEDIIRTLDIVRYVLEIMVQAKHTRKRQIILLQAEGFTAEEIRKALGKTITSRENEILNQQQ